MIKARRRKLSRKPNRWCRALRVEHCEERTLLAGPGDSVAAVESPRVEMTAALYEAFRAADLAEGGQLNFEVSLRADGDWQVHYRSGANFDVGASDVYFDWLGTLATDLAAGADGDRLRISHIVTEDTSFGGELTLVPTPITPPITALPFDPPGDPAQVTGPKSPRDLPSESRLAEKLPADALPTPKLPGEGEPVALVTTLESTRDLSQKSGLAETGGSGSDRVASDVLVAKSANGTAQVDSQASSILQEYAKRARVPVAIAAASQQELASHQPGEATDRGYTGNDSPPLDAVNLFGSSTSLVFEYSAVDDVWRQDSVTWSGETADADSGRIVPEVSFNTKSSEAGDATSGSFSVTRWLNSTSLATTPALILVVGTVWTKLRIARSAKNSAATPTRRGARVWRNENA